MANDAVIRELLAAVYAAPHDDGPRMVLADALQERGDPWGELIALQLGASDPGRERELIQAHAQAWLGGIADVVMPGMRRFARGFLVSCAVARLRPPEGAAIAERPEWATLERIRFWGGSDGEHYRTVVSPHMRSARALIELCSLGLEQLCREHADLPIEELHVQSTHTMNQPTRPIATLAACDGLARLRTLHLEFAQSWFFASSLEPLWPSAIARRLETLVLHNATCRGWLDWRVPTPRLAAVNIEGAWMLDQATRRAFGRPHSRPPDNRASVPFMWLMDVYERGYTRVTVELTGEAVSTAEARDELDWFEPPADLEVEFQVVSKDAPLPWEVIPDGV